MRAYRKSPVGSGRGFKSPVGSGRGFKEICIVPINVGDRRTCGSLEFEQLMRFCGRHHHRLSKPCTKRQVRRIRRHAGKGGGVTLDREQRFPFHANATHGQIFLVAGKQSQPVRLDEFLTAVRAHWETFISAGCPPAEGPPEMFRKMPTMCLLDEKGVRHAFCPIELVS